MRPLREGINRPRLPYIDFGVTKEQPTDETSEFSSRPGHDHAHPVARPRGQCANDSARGGINRINPFPYFDFRVLRQPLDPSPKPISELNKQAQVSNATRAPMMTLPLKRQTQTSSPT